MLHCLLVDDNPGFLATARRLLERQGITVVGVASSSAEALQRVEELRPDLVLVDIGLGRESGFELVGKLRTRAILVSTEDEEDYRDLIAASPAVGFLPKASLSARAIHDLLAAPTSEPRET
ncbi:DNA-binding NarL/FixJ family response regulator [Kibdelosporangium banguiense]|uniref:DNA-binding NarL/FixJ family response regulator n=1 Tax=Kibdelosporangium banguiense TaxID=1365924 RepID=A0ABS4T7F9_9PSEU|nr:response regulator transcription factor [Kibdelosporangium banguiense]MBP2320357.1 DNA-binding NarL/FixJ family response regulator [Kibdelosporangium banguiense]